MTEQNLQSVLEKVYASDQPAVTDLVYLLEQTGDGPTEQIMRFADNVRRRFVSDGIVLRGIVEFSNFCRNDCAYCGLNKHNTDLPRYRLTREQITQSVAEIAAAGIKTVVLQSGEDPLPDPLWLAQLIEKIKTDFDMAVTLSVGERSTEEYQLWKDAGADRYLLKIETTNPNLYERLHPCMKLENRLRCLDDLKTLGYQTGSGSIIGLKNQTCEDLARDIIFFRDNDFDMLGIGPFIPHERTPLANEPVGDMRLTLRTLALARIITRNTHLPATTAVGVAGSTDSVKAALKAGANVIMLNFTPPEYKKLYQIYSGRDSYIGSPDRAINKLKDIARSIGRNISFSRADSLKNRKENAPLGQVLVNSN